MTPTAMFDSPAHFVQGEPRDGRAMSELTLTDPQHVWMGGVLDMGESQREAAAAALFSSLRAAATPLSARSTIRPCRSLGRKTTIVFSASCRLATTVSGL
jgi:hypothetical protein